MFLPVNREQLNNCGSVDFVLISADAYVDHPTFGHAVIGRLFEAQGFSVGIIPQPVKDEDYLVFPKPNYAFLVSGGVVDSMVNNYTSAKKRRTDDEYSPYNKAGRRPDRAVTVYTKNIKRLFPDSFVIIGGIEASLRRFAHYDYWADRVMPSVLTASGADMLIYGMGENPVLDLSAALNKGIPLNKIRDLRGSAVSASKDEVQRLISKGALLLPSFKQVSTDKVSYAKCFKTQSQNTDPLNASVLVQEQENGIFILQNLPQLPLTEEQADYSFSLPYQRDYHPMYESAGGIKALEEVKFSVTSHRGCFGSCSFCALNYHQGRRIQRRSRQSVINECKRLALDKDFKGYIHDIGGPTANFYRPSCDMQKTAGVCKDKYCIGVKPCKNLKADHSEYLEILREARKIPGVKKVFIRSGVRFDYVMYDKNSDFFDELTLHHVSGQLKTAPEHSDGKVLKSMNKPPFSVYKSFAERFKLRSASLGLKQYIVPYFISSHPSCGVKEAVELTEYLKSINYMPMQVQDFYPTPSTRSTCMYYTGIDPDTMESVYTAKSYEDKKIQRALLQYRKIENRELVHKAYKISGKSMNFNENHKKNDTKPKKYVKINKNKGRDNRR